MVKKGTLSFVNSIVTYFMKHWPHRIHFKTIQFSVSHGLTNVNLF